MSGNCCGDCVTPNQSSSHVFSHAEKMFLTFSHIWLCTSITKTTSPQLLSIHFFHMHIHPEIWVVNSCAAYGLFQLLIFLSDTVNATSHYTRACHLQTSFWCWWANGFSQHCRERCRASVSNPEQTHTCKLYQLVPTACLHAKPRGDVDRRSLQRVMLSLFQLLTGRR